MWRRRTSAEILNHGFAHDLGSSIGTVGLQPGGFGNGDDGWGAIDSGRGGIHDTVAVELLHCAKEVNGARDIDVIIVEGDFGRFSDSFESLCND